MGNPIEVGRARGLCGEQVESDGGYYTDDFGATFRTSADDTIVIEAYCDCPEPRSVTLTGTRSGLE